MEERQFYCCMERMKAGDKSALHEIYHAYIGYIYTIILQIVQNREDAEDLTSEFFIKLWRLSHTYQEGKGHRAWLAVIARNMAFDLMRRRKKECLSNDLTDGISEKASHEDIEKKVIAEITLKAALELLKPKEREIIHLKILGELTFQEIADILKIPLGTVTWRYQSAIKKLRRHGYE